MNTFKIAFANIKKRKGASITFLIMVLLAALMLSISLSLIISVNDFYDKKAEELNAPHYTSFIYADSYKEEFTEFANAYKGKTDLCILDALFATAEWKLESSVSKMSYFVSETELYEKSFFKPEIIDKQASKTDDMIILPLGFKLNGIKSGEKVTFQFSGKNYTFTVYGFYEDPVNGNSTSSMSVAYIGEKNFKDLKAAGNLSNWINLMIRFENSEMSKTFVSDAGKIVNLSSNEQVSILYDESKMGASAFIQIISMLLIVFALIILIIAFIVVNFSIKNSISEDITQIGALKSIGYKSGALRKSQLIQYLLISITGTILGVIIFLLTFGFLGDIIANTSGLLWIAGGNAIPAIITIALISGLTLLFVYLSTRRYKKITPINALRQGESHHSFKRNHMPLEKHKMPLNLHLGVKRFFNSVKNSITLFIVVALLTFVSLVTYILSYNLNTDFSAMTQMAGIEQAEIWVQPYSTNDTKEIKNKIESNFSGKVENTLLYGATNCYVNGTSTFAESINDNTKLKTNTLIKGSLPKNNTEISLGATTAKAIGKDMGGTVALEINGTKRDYHISGIVQSLNNSGEGCQILPGAMLMHDEDFKYDTIFVYVKDGVDVKALNNEIKALLGSGGETMIYEDVVYPMLSSLGDPLSMVSTLMIVITVIVIAFVLFLIVSALIKKQKKEFGIMKAMGYKNRHIVLQLLISFLPSLLLGTVVGIILGFLVTNPLLSVVFMSMGLAKVYFIIPALVTALIGLSIFAVSMLISYLISLRLRKISPIKLIVEN